MNRHMDRTEIVAILPYGEEFLWVDRVVDLSEPGDIVTEFDYKTSSPLLAAHFASGPKVVPGALIIEQMCQSALLLAHRIGVVQSGYWLVPGKIAVRFHAPAYPECTIRVHIHVEQPIFNAFQFTGTANLHKQEVASAKVTGKLMTLQG